MGFSALSIRVFTGGAGCGKTYKLMESLSSFLLERPLDNGQKVLAITFMHGSRRRLDEKLSKVAHLSGKYECTTIDSFAWRIARRWRTLAMELGFANIQIGDYNTVIEATAALLEIDVVAQWVGAAFPILILDEAQDLTASRLRLISALASHQEVLSAADEFQCLNELLRPNPACSWLEQHGIVQVLNTPMRTQVVELLDAANALRSGLAPSSGTFLKIQPAPNAALAGSWTSNQIGWYGGGKTTAVLTSANGTYSRGVIEWVRNRTTRQNSGPYSLSWESSDTELSKTYLEAMHLDDEVDLMQVLTALTAGNDHRTTSDISAWLDRQRRTRGIIRWKRNEIERAVQNSFYLRRRQAAGLSTRLTATTVHGAKNREFDIVVVLWPAATVGSDDQKRRLLYNAITRAKNRCLILVQAQANMRAAPFA